MYACGHVSRSLISFVFARSIYLAIEDEKKHYASSVLNWNSLRSFIVVHIYIFNFAHLYFFIIVIFISSLIVLHQQQQQGMEEEKKKSIQTNLVKLQSRLNNASTIVFCCCCCCVLWFVCCLQQQAAARIYKWIKGMQVRSLPSN